jgi:hypothetical protein
MKLTKNKWGFVPSKLEVDGFLKAIRVPLIDDRSVFLTGTNHVDTVECC